MKKLVAFSDLGADMKALSVLVISLLTASCSLALLEPAPNIRPPDVAIYCTERSPLPVVDGVGGGLTIAGGIMAWQDGSLTDDEQLQGLGIGLIWGGVLAYSAIWGARTMKECREAVRQYNLERRRARTDTLAPMIKAVLTVIRYGDVIPTRPTGTS